MGQEKRVLPTTEKRKISLDRATVKTKERTVDLAFSSEEPIVRGWGIEILSHAPGAMRDTRTREGLPLLWNHDTGTLLGRLMDIRCNDDKKARGTARFSRSSNALEKWQDVEDGILTDVSVGYRVHYLEEMKPKEMQPDLMELAAREKLPVYRITDWEPYECSLVTAPADPTVGVGRTAEPAKAQEEKVPEMPQAISEIIKPKEERKMSDEKSKTLVEYETDLKVQTEKAAKDARENAEARVNGIHELGRRFASIVPQFITDKAVREGMPLDEFQRLVLARAENPKPLDTPVTEIGLSKNEIQRYSITRAISSLIPKSGVDAGFEQACHAELAKRLDRAPKGILVPYEVTTKKYEGRRDLSLGSDAAGAYLRGTDHLGSEFIEVLYNAMAIRRLGCRVLSGLRGNVSIPKRTAGVTSYWVAEGVAPTEGSNTFGALTLTPNNVAANVDYTRNLLLQSNPSIDALVNNDIAQSLAVAIDLAAFHGAGTDEPQGIVGTSNVGSTTATSVTFAKMLDFQTDVAAANALAPNCAYVTTPSVAAILATTPKHATAIGGWLWEGGILESNNVCGFRGVATNQISSGYMIFGDFSQLILGEWGVLELVVDPYTQSKTGIIQVTAFQSVDVGLRYPAAFSVSTSVTSA